MGLKVRHSFNSPQAAAAGAFEYSVKIREGMEKFFYFSAYPADGKSCISIYRQTKAQPGALVFYPLLIPLAQTYARFGNSPSDTVTRTIRLVEEKRLLDGNFPIIQISSDGKLAWSRSGFSAPLLFRPATSDFRFMHDSQGTGDAPAEAGDLFLIFDDGFIKKIGMHFEEILYIFKTSADSSVRELSSLILDKLRDSGEPPDFFCLVRVTK